MTDDELRTYLQAMETRLGERITHVETSLLTEMAKSEERAGRRRDELERRLKRVDANTMHMAEQIVSQNRWHEQSDNALSDLQKRVEKLERGKDAA